MSTGDSIYQSVRLFCVTIFLIALLSLMPQLSRIYVAYQLTKDEQQAQLRRQAIPQIEVPTFRIRPELREGKL
jgi:CHASE1-domain containing sensor protein